MQIEIYNIKTALTKELLTSEEKFNILIAQIDNLGGLIFDFSSKEEVKKAKSIKTDANKFVKELKEFCEPLEAEGKKIADARSKITTRLVTGRDNVIDKLLKPVNDAEDKIKYLKSKCNTPIQDLHSVSAILNECQELQKFNWLYLEEEALLVINQLKGAALLAKETLEAEAKLKAEAEEKVRLEREFKIAEEATEKARRAAEDSIRQAEMKAKNAELLAQQKAEEAARNERLKIEFENKAREEETARREADKNHRISVNKEILEDLEKFIDRESAKKIILAAAEGEIRHLSVRY